MAVGRRCIDQDGIEWQSARFEQARHVRQEDRDVVGAALVHRSPGIGPDEQGPVAEIPRHRRREVRPRPLDVEVDDTDRLELRGTSDEGVEQDRWRRRRAVDVDLVP